VKKGNKNHGKNIAESGLGQKRRERRGAGKGRRGGGKGRERGGEKRRSREKKVEKRE